MKSILKYLLNFIIISMFFQSCNRHDLDKIEFRTGVAGIFPLFSKTDSLEIEDGTQLWFENFETNEEIDSLLFINDLVDKDIDSVLNVYNLAQRDIETIIPETISMALFNVIEEGETDVPAANWRFLRSAQIFIYNEGGNDSLLLARLDTVSTSINAVITLNPNTESIRPFLINEQFKLKALLEFRNTVSRDYGFIFSGINRVEGSIK